MPQLRALVPQLLTLGEYAPEERTGPAIWLRCVIDRALAPPGFPSDTTPIVYLPGTGRQKLGVAACPDRLKPLVELQYRGACWTRKNGRDWTVEAFLASWDGGGLGLDVARDATTRRSMQRALTALATTPVAALRGRRLEAEDFDRLFSDDPVRDVLAWMSDPEAVRAGWEAGRWSAFASRCKAELGFDPEKDGGIVAAERLGRREGAWESVWWRFAEAPARYPGVPECLRKAMPDDQRHDLFAEPSSWPQNNEGEEAALRGALLELEHEAPRAAREQVVALEKTHGPRRGWVWATLDQAPLANALAPLAALAARASNELGGASVAEMAGLYAGRAWEIDAAALDGMAAVKSAADAQAVSAALNAIYGLWLESAARRLQVLAQKEPLPGSDAGGAPALPGEASLAFSSHGPSAPDLRSVAGGTPALPGSQPTFGSGVGEPEGGKSERGESERPAADVVIGNPPFLGGKLLNAHFGEGYVSRLFTVYRGRVPAEADLVCYWFVKAGEQMRAGRAKRAGLVSTNSIGGGANRRALQAAIRGCPIFEAWSDEPWVVEGATVRVSLVCFSRQEPEDAPRPEDASGREGAPEPPERRLDGRLVDVIHADLSARRGGAGVDLTGAQRLYRNLGVAFMGDTKGGTFDVRGEQARDWLCAPANPNGRSNADVLRPWMNGMDVTRRPADKWIVDFGWDMVREEAALYEAPWRHAREHVYPMRQRNRRESYRERWWRHVEPRQGMWRALAGLSRYIATPTVAKHRLFVWLDAGICPDHQLIVIAREDDTTFGILHSRFHEAWSLRLGTWLGKGNDPRYTPTTTFETFPFPDGLSPLVPADEYTGDPRAAAIARAARRLAGLRERWLNPPEWVEWVAEPAPGYPKRPVPRDEAAARALKARTLTNLYNTRPQWLADAHAALGAAVAAAYGWPEDLGEEEALRALLALNAGGSAPV